MSFRLAVRAPTDTVRRWNAWAVAAALDEPEARLVLLIESAGRPIPDRSMRGRVTALYERLDRRLLAPADDAAECVPLESKPDVVACDADAIAALVAAQPDVLLDFGDPKLPTRDLPCAVWRVSFGEHRSVAPTAHDLISASGVCLVELEEIGRERSARVIACAYAGTDEASLARARSRVLWRAAVITQRALRRRIREEPTPIVVARPRADTEVNRLDRWITASAWRIAARRAKKLVGRDEWCVGVRPAEDERQAAEQDGPISRTPSFSPVEQPRSIYRADPFVIQRDGRTFIFVEEFVFERARAHIAVGELEGCALSRPFEPCLTRPYHLSYPFVFEHDGAVYMLPETFESNRVELYVAKSFPFDWTLATVLLDDVQAVDSTLFFDSGRWWLFTNIVTPPASGDEELFVFHAPRLGGPWRPHAANPVVSDARFARCGGRIFRQGAAVVRPAQDAARRYGSALNFRYVTNLTDVAYEEQTAGRVDSRWFPRAHATHSYDRTASCEVTDGERWRVRSKAWSVRGR